MNDHFKNLISEIWALSINADHVIFSDIEKVVGKSPLMKMIKIGFIKKSFSYVIKDGKPSGVLSCLEFTEKGKEFCKLSFGENIIAV